MKEKIKLLTVFTKILNAIDHSITVIDRDGKVIFINQAALNFLEVTRENSVGFPFVDIFPETQLPSVIESGESAHDVIMTYREKFLIADRTPVFNDVGEIIAAVAIFKDVTTQNELRNKVGELNSNRILLETIIDSVQEAISVVDEYGFFRIVNDAYTRVSGRSKEEVINKSISEVVPEKEISIHKKVFHTHKSEMDIRYDFGVNHDTVVGHVSPLMVEGEFKGTVAVVHNIENVRKITSALDNAATVITELNKGKAKYSFDNISSASKAMKDTVSLAKKVAKTPVTVLIRGESGTGKELLAHSIHNYSDRRNQRFISVNCAAIPYNLIESVLFGYKEGAFTGAIKGGHTGIFETCNKGTVFLDEIGELNMETQVKLLRVLQEKEIVKVGDTTPHPVDVRIVAATNANLEEMVLNNRFRKDLYYRLNVFPLTIPSLRERSQDIPDIAREMIRQKNNLLDRHISDLSERAIKKLKQYFWPGNIRELENIITRSMLACDEDSSIIDADCIPPLADPLDNTSQVNCDTMEYSGESYRYLFEKWERRLIEGVMIHHEGNKKEAAQSLQISLKNLYNKLNYYKI